jgi:hypothetical protein
VIQAYADDIILAANNEENLQNLINYVNNFFDFANIKLNPGKSEIMKINGEKDDAGIIIDGVKKEYLADNSFLKYLSIPMEMIKWLRIMVDWKLNTVNNIHIILCSEFEYLMFEIFLKLVIKLTIYHKNETIVIESYQFRNGKSYVIKIGRRIRYRSNRSVMLKTKEIWILENLGLGASELFLNFSPVMLIMKRPKDKLIEKIYDFEDYLIMY